MGVFGFLLGTVAIIYPGKALPIVASLSVIRLIRRKRRRPALPTAQSGSAIEYHASVPKADLSWQHLSCSLKAKSEGGQDKQILSDVSGEARAGRQVKGSVICPVYLLGT